jgi:exopolysaccharide biosynthesis polyprenyl glycosylphosphotransferase
VTPTDFPSRRRRRAIVRGALLASDAVTLFAATQLASLVRFGQILHIPSVPGLPIWFNLIDLSFLITAIWLVILWGERLYDLHHVFWGTGEYSRVIRALSVGIVGIVVVEYLLKLPGLSRAWLLLAWGFASASVIGGRSIVRWAVAAARRQGHLLRPTLIVGFNAEAADIIRALRKDVSSGLVPIGCLASSQADQLSLDYCVDGDVPCLGTAGDIRTIVDERFIDTVLIASTAFEHDVLARIINELRDRDLDIQLSSGLFDVTTSRVMIRETSGIPLITIRGVSFSPWKSFVKRTFDLVMGSLIILVGTPIWVLVALGIKLGSRGPVLYRQGRIGRDGVPFDMFKFRSMYADAEARLAELREAGANEATGPLFKMKDDPRVTPVGKWMRKFSIDEFPQLINVMRGDMSLVGPRPPLPGETSSYTDQHWRRMEVLPGMTGLWQVSGRSKLSFDEMVRLDLFYMVGRIRSRPHAAHDPGGAVRQGSVLRAGATCPLAPARPCHCRAVA